MSDRYNEVSVPEEAVEAEPEQQVAERKTHVEWATARGMVPKILEQPKVQSQGLISGRINPKWDEYAQARAHHGWLPNQEMTEAEFLAALEAPKAHVFR